LEVPACCPHCDETFLWSVSLAVDRELAWAAPHAPLFLFRCAACSGAVRITFEWALRRGSDPRPLRIVGGPSPLSPAPRILLVDTCPHGCGTRLGLQLEPEEPGAELRAWPDQPLVLGGYRCPSCDGEGVLSLRVRVLGPDGSQV
jgi:hypothetical protein